MVATASVIGARNSSKLTGTGGTKTLTLTYPNTKNPGMSNQAIVVAKLSFHEIAYRCDIAA
jgi:hypothetical protein